MRTIAKLFGKSPFSPLQTHMEKVSVCVGELLKILEALSRKDYHQMEELAAKISNLEHEADLTKNDIRNHLPRSLFMPIDRGQFLEILSIQDSLADKAEEVGNLFVLKSLDPLPTLLPHLERLINKNVEAFSDTYKIMGEIDELLESSFGGVEAEKVKAMIDQTSYKEHESDVLKTAALKQLFLLADDLPYPSFYLWLRIIEKVSDISHIAEKLAGRIRMILEIK